MTTKIVCIVAGAIIMVAIMYIIGKITDDKPGTGAQAEKT
jgi:hypothetical protein